MSEQFAHVFEGGFVCKRCGAVDWSDPCYQRFQLEFCSQCGHTLPCDCVHDQGTDAFIKSQPGTW